MKHTDGKTGDKVPRAVSSEEAQRGEQVPGPVLEKPDPKIEAVDKVITPTSIKEQEAETEAIKRQLAQVDGKLRE
ncbi:MULTISPECIES: hypothetical protein [Pseudomonas]|uniref:hypothetical protein n=1 Tax=Pseudomonas TaxID=286 RepID=UPI00244D21AD|nr:MULTISPECIES: hypothetical protein [Pseudomonas]MDH1549105.1 hypothetical protein [Pseudomonas juntendi]